MSAVVRPRTKSQPMTDAELDQLAINTIRTLSIDAVQQAKSGHPGRADGAGAARLRAVESDHAIRSAGPDLAEPRSLRALQRPRLDAAVVAAASDRHARRQCRIRAAGPARRCRSTTSGTSASSAARRPAILSTIWFRASRRRPVRWGRASATASAWRLPRSGSRSLQSRGLRDLRLRHLRGLWRRRHDGGCLLRSRLACRPSAAR